MGLNGALPHVLRTHFFVPFFLLPPSASIAGVTQSTTELLQALKWQPQHL